MYSPRDVFLSRTATGVCVGSLAAISCAVIIRIAWILRTGIPRALTASAVIVLVSLIGCALSYSSASRSATSAGVTRDEADTGRTLDVASFRGLPRDTPQT